MKRLIATFAMVFSLALASIVIGPPASGSTVVRVVDGDTVKVTFYGRPLTLRLYCIDAPESKQPYGPEASAALTQAVGSNVSVKVLRQDRYGRSVARVRVNRRDISLAMVKQGLAWEYKTLCKDPRFAAAEEVARAAKLGLWADDTAINPAEWRKGVRP